MSRTYYVTTPIYYVNGEPHIGHVHTTVAADILARYKRMRGNEVFLLTGADEHGQKIQATAEKRGIPPKQHVDEMSQAFKDIFATFHIDYSRFIRTTDADHEGVVKDLFTRLKESGDIYLGEYEGWYSPSEEEFVPDNQVKDGKDPDGKPLVFLKEASYFFALSKYEERLRRCIEEDRFAITPESRKNEVLGFLKQGLKDLSISRTSISWGIPVPGDPEHVVYVWMDALLNYISGIGYSSENGVYHRFWPANVQLIGKEILRFHAVYWPAILMAAGLELPLKLVSHGWWTNHGKKMSKSLGNFLRPEDLLKHFDVDSIRYFLMREKPFGEDGDLSIPRMVERLNADLANDLGNGLNRVLGLLEKYYGGKVPEPGPSMEEDHILSEPISRLLAKVDGLFNQVLLDDALKEIWEYISFINKYVNDMQPWVLHKQGDTERLGTVLYNCVEGLRVTALLIYPFMPEKAQGMWRQLGFTSQLSAANINDSAQWGLTPPGQVTSKAEVLFPKLELPEEFKAPKPEAPKAEKKKKKAAPAGPPPEIGYDDFAKVELKAATVVEAERVPKSDKLLRLQVAVGEERRQIVAGIGKAYEPEAMVGKQIIIVANLKPAKIFGVESQGMLLACGDTDDLKVASFDGEVNAGTRVK